MQVISEGFKTILQGNDYLFHCFNNLSGQSIFFDKVMGLGLSSNLVKASVVGACFMLAWLASGEPAKVAHRRKVLLITLVSSIFVLGTTRIISKAVFLPRPFVLSQRSFHLENGQLVETPREHFKLKTTFDDDTQKTGRRIGAGHDSRK